MYDKSIIPNQIILILAITNKLLIILFYLVADEVQQLQGQGKVPENISRGWK